MFAVNEIFILSGSMGTETSMYVSELLQALGHDIVVRCYWDFGDWSDLMKQWKIVPENITLLVRSCSIQQNDCFARCNSLPEGLKKTVDSGV